MSALNLFIPISKVDVAKRLVYGIATAEKLDRSGEICDYATTKPYYQKWSGDIEKTTDGKSLGNIRAMHGKVAAGKVTAVNYDDVNKQIEICGKVVDDAEWNKVTEGVYTGFSHGGAYVKRWTDDQNQQRYTADPSEISLVDLPCLAEATFKVVKADGATEDHHFKTVIKEPTNDEVLGKARELAKAAGDADQWEAQLEPAREALRKTALKIEPPADALTVIAADEKIVPEVIAAKVESPVDGPQWEQVWKSKRDGATFKTKDELRKHHEELDAAAATDCVTKAALDAIAAIETDLGKKDYTDEERKAMAGHEAMPDGSFPIKDKADLKNAIRDFARASDPESAKSHIVGRAKSLDATDMLPSTWAGSSAHDDKSVTTDKPTGNSTKVATDDLGKTTPNKETVKAPTEGSSPAPAQKHTAMSAAHRSIANDFTKDAKGYAADGNAKLASQARDHARAHDDAADLHDRAAKMFGDNHPDAEKCMKEAFAASDWANTKTGTAVKAAGEGRLFKGLGTVARLAMLLQDLAWLESSVQMESRQEGDNSPVVAQLQGNIRAVCDTLNAMCAEECSELIAGQDDGDGDEPFGIFGMSAGAGHAAALVKFMQARPELAKADKFIEKLGSRHNKSDMNKIQTMHDSAVELGAECRDAGKAADPQELAKVAGELAKVTAERDAATAERDALRKGIEDKIMPRLAGISAQITKLDRAPRPLPYAPGTRAVDKTADGVIVEPPSGSVEESLEDMVKTPEGRDRLTTLMIKASQQTGGQRVSYR